MFDPTLMALVGLVTACQFFNDGDDDGFFSLEYFIY